jgi:integrase
MIETAKKRTRKAKDRDGVYKRRGYWHFEYKDPRIARWRSKSTGKKSYNEAKEFKKQFLDSLQGQYDPDNDRLSFSAAADDYIQHRVVAASAGTVRLEKERLRALKKLLIQIAGPDLKLKAIDIRLVRNYQQRRIAEGVGPRTVNMEGQLLRSILKHHQQWKLDDKYAPLPEPVSTVGRALTPEQEVKLIDTAKSCGRWFVAYHATVLENETGMRGVELRHLQLKGIDLAAGEIHLEKSKTKGGIRKISLSADAMDSVRQLLDRAQKLGVTKPVHYLFPKLVQETAEGKNGNSKRVRVYDPTRPTTGWRTAWRKLTEKAGLKGLRGHDLRHNWITGHAEIGTPQSVLEAQAGQLSKRVSDHYKHISEKAARKAADDLARVKAAQREEARTKIREEEEAKSRASADSAPAQVIQSELPMISEAIQ